MSRKVLSVRSSFERRVRSKLFRAINPDTMASSTRAVLVALVYAEMVNI